MQKLQRIWPSDSYSLSNSNSGESTSASEEETPKKKTQEKSIISIETSSQEMTQMYK